MKTRKRELSSGRPQGRWTSPIKRKDTSKRLLALNRVEHPEVAWISTAPFPSANTSQTLVSCAQLCQVLCSSDIAGSEKP